jgi:hypothetical protein
MAIAKWLLVLWTSSLLTACGGGQESAGPEVVVEKTLSTEGKTDLVKSIWLCNATCSQDHKLWVQYTSCATTANKAMKDAPDACEAAFDVKYSPSDTSCGFHDMPAPCN